jgi:hypothetical protein
MKHVLAISILMMSPALTQASTWWVRTTPPIPSGTKHESRDSKVFSGTHMELNELCARSTWVQWSDRNRGFPVPPHPTAHQTREDCLKTEADVHMTPEAVQKMASNENAFASIMGTVTPAPTSTFFQLGHKIYAIGLENAKNGDGSLDIHIDERVATAGGKVILTDPHVLQLILQGA